MTLRETAVTGNGEDGDITRIMGTRKDKKTTRLRGNAMFLKRKIERNSHVNRMADSRIVEIVRGRNYQWAQECRPSKR